jgi:NAD(P)-dependent dehydrogenase (short-subunit alcohol dehydrogenase family)
LIRRKEIESFGRRTLRVTSDVSERISIENLLDECVRQFGKVDILINSAGRTKREPTLDFAEQDWNDILETNLTGTCEPARFSVVI